MLISQASCEPRRKSQPNLWLIWQDLYTARSIHMHILRKGLSKENGSRNLALQGMQEDSSWRCMDRIYDRCRNRQKVGYYIRRYMEELR